MMRCVRWCVALACVFDSAGCAMLQRQADASPDAALACIQTPSPDATVPSDIIKEVQARLILLGYGAGPVDGVLGERTRHAIRSYQSDHGLLTDGLATPELAVHLKGSAGASGEPAPLPAQNSAPN